jgi:hypothetical protein
MSPRHNEYGGPWSGRYSELSRLRPAVNSRSADLNSIAKAILNYLNAFGPDLIIVELGDGIVAATRRFDPEGRRDQSRDLILCLLRFGLPRCYWRDLGLQRFGIGIDVVAGSVTDSQMGEDFIQDNFGVVAGNARRDGARLFRLVARNRIPAVSRTEAIAQSSEFRSSTVLHQ